MLARRPPRRPARARVAATHAPACPRARGPAAPEARQGSAEDPGPRANCGQDQAGAQPPGYVQGLYSQASFVRFSKYTTALTLETFVSGRVKEAPQLRDRPRNHHGRATRPARIRGWPLSCSE
jgi:hypothetical protein